MSTLTVTRNYADGDDLTEAELDAAFDSLETFCNGNIGTTNIATNGVDTAQLASSSVTAAKIASDAVTTAKILDSNVTTAKIADLAVTTGKIAANAVTQAKMVTLNQTLTSSSGNYTTTSASYVQPTNLSGAITGRGVPIRIELQSDGSGNPSSLTTASGGTNYVMYWQILRDSTEIATGALAGAYPVSAISITDTGAGAASYTYTVKIKNASASGTSMGVAYAKLLLREEAGGV